MKLVLWTRHCLIRLQKDESGVTTVEYALLLALIMVFCISAILSSGDVQQALWFNTATRMEVINQ